MARRWLSLQVCFNLLGLCIASVFFADDWAAKLTAAGVAGIMLAGVMQMLGFRHKIEDPVDRGLLGANEAFAGVAISIIEPLALVCTLIAVLFALVAGGMKTVMTANATDDQEPPKVRGEGFRRLATGVLILALSLVALQHLRVVDFDMALNATTTEWITLVACIWFLISTRGVIDLIIAVTRKPKD